jgi:tetratricopeptide (TPR) repeat protein
MSFDQRGASRRRILGRLALRDLAVASALLLTACATPEAGIAPTSAAPPAPAVSAYGDSGTGAYLAGRAAQQHHDLSLASLYLTRALNDDPENVELLQRTTIALTLEGRLAEAATVAERLESFDEEATAPAMLLAERRVKQGDWPGALAVVDKLPPRGLNNYLLPLVRGWAAAGENKTDDAIAAFGALDSKSGLAVLRDFNIGLVNDLADRNDAAEAAYKATLAAPAGRTLRTIEVVGNFLHRHGRDEEAKALGANLFRDHPDLPPLVIGAQRDVANASDGLAEAFFAAAGTIRAANAPEEALLFTRLSLDLKPTSDLASLMEGDLLTTLGQPSLSNKAYEALPDGSVLYPTAQLRIARNLEEMGEIDSAAHLLEGMVERHVVPLEGLLALGDLYRRQHRWLEAVHAYDRALPLLQGNAQVEWPVLYARGVALERANQWPRAEADLLHALEIQPDDPEVLNYLGYSWVEQGTNLPRATQMIEKAAMLRPADGFIADSLGWAFYRSGQYGRAVETLQHAVALVPGDATINDHLGDALWSAGRQEEARFQWQHALLSDPDPDLKAQIVAKLTKAAKDTQ